MSTHKSWASVYLTLILFVFLLSYLFAQTAGSAIGFNQTGKIPNNSFPTEVVD